MKYLIASIIVILSFMASSYANVTHYSYKLKSKVSKVKIKTTSKKESPVTVPYCVPTHHKQAME